MHEANIYMIIMTVARPNNGSIAINSLTEAKLIFAVHGD